MCVLVTDFDHELIDSRPGSAILRIKSNTTIFDNEGGCHSIIRVPPTEKRGRVQTSVVTVAVMPEPKPTQFSLRESDLEIKTCRSGGKGGQHVNKTESAVQITHIPTGTAVRCESERSQHQNKATALAELTARLWAVKDQANTVAGSQARRDQIGYGVRGHKRRTIRVLDDKVVDHITGKTWTYKKYSRGDW